jgi:hypothetical protein
MGTAGPLALARELLDDGSGTPFFVLNRCVPCFTSQTPSPTLHVTAPPRPPTATSFHL